MIVLIIAGGSGTRLWPLSTPKNPKHLLKINGNNTSLLQQTYERAKLLTDTIYVVTEATQVDAIMQQLPQLSEDNVIVEPASRGTANCLINALVKLESRFEPGEILASMHADHYIRDLAGFVNSFNLAKHMASKSSNVVLLGAEPDYPSTGFGYIEKGELLEDQTFSYRVKSFREKPDFETAKLYLQSGNYLWNCGYFVAKLGTFVNSMKIHAPDIYKNYQKLSKAGKGESEKIYLSFENLAIDYALIEKLPDLLVIPASFDWMDLGTFNDLSVATGGDEQGNSIHGTVQIEDVQNSLIQNHEQKPVLVIGMDNIVVINTPDGTLVVRKDLSQKVGEVSKRISTT